MKKILAIIPTRGDSKGLPKKNIFNFCGKPLLAWTIETALRSKYINRTIVSSDDQKISELAKIYGAEIIKRPKKVSEKSNYPPRDVIFHALGCLKKIEDYEPDIIIYLQSTSPLRDYHDIDKALELMFAKKAGGIISVYEINKKYFWSYFLNKKGYLERTNKEFGFSLRQNLPDLYMPNGAIYIMKRDFFLKSRSLFTSKSIPYIMSIERSIDIDEMRDLTLAKKIFRKYKNKK